MMDHRLVTRSADHSMHLHVLERHSVDADWWPPESAAKAMEAVMAIEATLATPNTLNYQTTSSQTTQCTIARTKY